jgi:hypothetical protein
MSNKFYLNITQWISFHLPPIIVYWCGIKIAAVTGYNTNINPRDISIIDACSFWGRKYKIPSEK